MQRGFQYGRAREIPYDKQTVYNTPAHRVHTSETSINQRYSQEIPPQWGPHRQHGEGYPFRRWKEEVRRWVEVNRVTEDKRGHLLFTVLQGIAFDTANAWLTIPNREERRRERLRRGNRKYRIKRWNERLSKKFEELQLAKLAELQVEIEYFGEGGDTLVGGDTEPQNKKFPVSHMWSRPA